MDFTELERALIDWISTRTNDPRLQRQFSSCRPVQRKLTGVGSFTQLVTSHRGPGLELNPSDSPVDGPWIHDCESIPHGGSALVFLDEFGYIDTLEIASNGDRFDWRATNFVLHD